MNLEIKKIRVGNLVAKWDDNKSEFVPYQIKVDDLKTISEGNDKFRPLKFEFETLKKHFKQFKEKVVADNRFGVVHQYIFDKFQNFSVLYYERNGENFFQLSPPYDKSKIEYCHELQNFWFFYQDYYELEISEI